MIAEQLKKSILQAAIQGKLTEQLPEDGDARDLLKEIQKEKQRLIKEGKIKKEKLLPEITEDEIPFDIPANWCWVRLSGVFSIARGESPRPIQSYLTTNSDGINWIKIGDTEIGGKYIEQAKEKIKPEGLKKSRLVRSGDLLLTNSMSFGRPYILNINGCIHDGWLVLSPLSEDISREYFFYLISSELIQNAFVSTVAGAVVKNLNSDKVRTIIAPLPSLNEQNRIVERLAEVLPLIDKLAGDETKLDELLMSFPKKMKDAIIQAAIQGKLTEQLPEDGDASDLLKEIQKEKQRLIREGKIKKDKPLPEITEDEIPFDIPANWCWVRLGLLVRVISGTSYNNKDLETSGIRIIRGGNIIEDKCELQLFDDDVFVSTKLNDKNKTPMKGDVIIVASTGSKNAIGKPAYINTDFSNTQIGAFIRIIRPINAMLFDFVIIIFKSRYYREHIRSITQGTNINNIKAEHIEHLIVPFPPLSEQHRITERLNQLLPLCEAVE